MYHSLRQLLYLCVLASTLLSCSAERKLASQYLKEVKGEGIMLLPDNFIYKGNPGAVIDARKFPTPGQQDSVAYATSNFVQFLSDSIFLTNFTNSLIEELEDYGFVVTLDESADLFFSSPKPKWIVQLSQIEIDEDFTPQYAYCYDDEQEAYSQEYRKNTISLNTWTEVNKINAENGVKQMLYLSGYIEDDDRQLVTLNYIDGVFYLHDDRDTLTLSSVYSMARASGKKHAELLFDYFLNDYIRENLSGNGTFRKEMHYNKRLKRIESGLNERFDVINSHK